MKIILPLLLLVPVLLAAEDEKLAELVTLDGKTYQGVTIRKVEPDGLSILHAAGTAKVPFEKLPEELQEKYGYDATAAAEHRKQAAEAQRKQDAAERAAGEKRKKEAAKAAMAEADKGFAEKVEKAAKMMRVRAFKNTRLGLAGDIYVGALTTERVRSTLGSTTGHKPVWDPGTWDPRDHCWNQGCHCRDRGRFASHSLGGKSLEDRDDRVLGNQRYDDDRPSLYRV